MESPLACWKKEYSGKKKQNKEYKVLKRRAGRASREMMLETIQGRTVNRTGEKVQKRVKKKAKGLKGRRCTSRGLSGRGR